MDIILLVVIIINMLAPRDVMDLEQGNLMSPTARYAHQEGMSLLKDKYLAEVFAKQEHFLLTMV